MPGFTALNGSGGASPRPAGSDVGGSIEVRLSPSKAAEREHNGNSVPSSTAAEPRIMPDIAASAHREREGWDDRSPRQSTSTATATYPNVEMAATNAQKRKRSLSVDEPPRQPVSMQPSNPEQQQQQKQPQYGTDAVAIAAAAVAARGTSRDRELNHPHAHSEPRDAYDPSRSRDYTRPFDKGLQREQQEQRGMREQREQREQQRAELWYNTSPPTREERLSTSAYDDTRYATVASSMQSPVDEQPGSDLHHRDRSAGHGSVSPQSEYAGRTPDEEDRPNSMPSVLSPSQPRRDPTTVQHADPKRRKRNFSNRTKTGCLTCRKRKKKCDETKPECSNCVRGGFICAGYPPQKGQWGKVELPKATVQIESKDPTYVPPGAYGMPRIGALDNQVGPYQQQRRDQQPSYRGPILRIEPPLVRPLQTDDDRQTATTLPSSILASPENQNKLSALSNFSAPANPFPTPVSANTNVPFMERTPKEYQRVPPLHDLSRNEPDPAPQHSTPLPQISVHSGSPMQQQRSPPQHPLHHPPPHTQQPSQQLQQRHQPPLQQKQTHHVHQNQPIQHSPDPHAMHVHQPQAQYTPHQYHHQHLPHMQQQQEQSPIEQPQRVHHRAYSPPVPSGPQQKLPAVNEDSNNNNGTNASSSEARARPRLNVPFFNTIPGGRREKDEMYAGRPFFQFDKELVAERERCAAACWKFNNSMNPNIGVSLSERTRLFKEILQPRDELQMSPIARAGSVGEQVIVEAPFHADYGYNITIGEDVYIGRNCHISDAMSVSIGNRVYIGPNVSFYTTTLSTDPAQREGVHSAIHGQSITIGDDVFIGGNVTILAGVSIGHGTTVGAGSVVSTLLPRYTVCYGRPAEAKRGVARA